MIPVVSRSLHNPLFLSPVHSYLAGTDFRNTNETVSLSLDDITDHMYRFHILQQLQDVRSSPLLKQSIAKSYLQDLLYSNCSEYAPSLCTAGFFKGWDDYDDCF